MLFFRGLLLGLGGNVVFGFSCDCFARFEVLRELRARLLQKAQEEAHAKEAEARRAQVGTGERAEKIRTYNFPEGRVTDHRIKLTVHQLQAVLEGDLDEFVDALLAQERAAQLVAARAFE